MTALAPPPPPAVSPRSDQRRTRRSVPRTPRPTVPAPPSPSSDQRGGRVLFTVPFASAMADPELARLRRVLDISTHMQPKMRPDPASLGVARLDHRSGLFLERATGEGQWLFEARTWGQPAPDTVHEWQLLAAQAARQLDPQVTLPQRLGPSQQSPAAVRAPGTAENKRSARLRRRLAGVR